MPIPLGIDQAVLVKRPEGNVAFRVRALTNKERNQYSSKIMEFAQRNADTPGERLKTLNEMLEYRQRCALDIVRDCDIEPPEGMSKQEALETFGGPWLEDLCKKVYDADSDTDAEYVDLKKYELTSSSSKRASSARSSKKRASGSNRSGSKTGTHSAATAPTANAG